MSDSAAELARLRSRIDTLDEAWNVATESDAIHEVRLRLYQLIKQAVDQYHNHVLSTITIKETTNV